jgi:3-oxoacyl-[acyl-carrier protein] reductase
VHGESGFRGRTALVTGAGRNIGRAIALGLARAGANVAVNVRSSIEEGRAVVAAVEAEGVQAALVVGDVADPDVHAGIVDDVLAAFGSLDYLINNAALRRHAPILEMTLEEWNEVIAADLTAPFNLCRLVLPHMVERRFGRIINLGGADPSKAGPGRAHVLTAKVGLGGLTRAIAVEFGHVGVTANVISPAVPSHLPAENYPEAPSSQVFLDKNFAIPRPGTAEEVAAACVYLTSTEAAYVTGQNLRVNGGYEML